MAIRVNFELMDDVDGTVSPDVEKVHFGLDGTAYEIDLTAANAAQLRGLLAEFIGAGRRMGQVHVSVPTVQHLKREPASRGEAMLIAVMAQERTPAGWQTDDRKSA